MPSPPLSKEVSNAPSGLYLTNIPLPDTIILPSGCKVVLWGAMLFGKVFGGIGGLGSWVMTTPSPSKLKSTCPLALYRTKPKSPLA